MASAQLSQISSARTSHRGPRVAVGAARSSFFSGSRSALEASSHNARVAVHQMVAQAAATAEKEATIDNKAVAVSQVGLVGLAVMGQNLALNVAEKGFSISVYNRSSNKTEEAVRRAAKEGLSENLMGFGELKDFVASLKRPRSVIILVKAGAPVDATIQGLLEFMEPGDIIIDGGNEWYENTERRSAEVAARGIKYMGMGVSGGEEGARNGPSLMPGGDKEAFDAVEPIIRKVAAQVDDGPCTMYVGKGGAGNFVKMVHNGIEYGDMQLISETYDVLKNVGGLSNEELEAAFVDWNKGELDSFLIEISSLIFGKKDDQVDDGSFLVDKIVDTGMKGTGKWTVQQGAELSVACPTIEASLDGRFLSGLKDERVAASALYAELGAAPADAAPPALSAEDKAALIDDVRSALYAAKICSYAQGMNLIRAKSAEQGWGIDFAELARIWKGGCIIRAKFLDRIAGAYRRDSELASLLVDREFAAELVERSPAWRRVINSAVTAGVSVPGLSTSLAYFDQYRRERLPANLVQAQRDFFGSHTYERNDGKDGWFHTVWSDMNSADSITTEGYLN